MQLSFDEQETLFDEQVDAARPLAARMRPTTLDEVAGQQHLIGPGKVLRRIIEADQVQSMIFWGPPGVGKTTLARVIAHQTQATFIDFSAVTSGIKEIREVMKRADSMSRAGGRTIVFSDEIHGDLMLKGHRHTSFLTVSDNARAVGVVMGAPSKTFNIAGIVSSWCVVKNPELRLPFFNWLTTNSQSAPNFLSMTATRAAYRHGGEWLSQCLEYIEGNIDMVVDYCRDHIPGIRAIKPQASFLVWLDCTGLGLEHDALIDLFVNKARLGLNDGAMFGKGGSGFMRLNVAVPRSILRQAMLQLEASALVIKQQ